ncbi:MAG: hypothetical protein ACJ8AI_04275 [Rhodopila sp.]
MTALIGTTAGTASTPAEAAFTVAKDITAVRDATTVEGITTAVTMAAVTMTATDIGIEPIGITDAATPFRFGAEGRFGGKVRRPATSANPSFRLANTTNH